MRTIEIVDHNGLRGEVIATVTLRDNEIRCDNAEMLAFWEGEGIAAPYPENAQLFPADGRLFFDGLLSRYRGLLGAREK